MVVGPTSLSFLSTPPGVRDVAGRTQTAHFLTSGEMDEN
jgi:hypothetical protein